MKNNVDNSCYEVHFGGPDMPAYCLRDLLAERVAAVPSGGSIDWVTYYFRDRRLAGELLRAARRGVRVHVTLERHPRTAHANDAVIAMLSGPDGLGEGLRTISIAGLTALSWIRKEPHLHEKIYCFSHPEPTAFIGSFNPSGDLPEEDPEIIREIGDQDRGHNFLVGIRDPVLVEKLVEHVRCIHRIRHVLWYRFSASANRTIRGMDTDIYFWPRIRSHPVVRFLMGLGKGTRLRMAASHLKGGVVVNAIIRMARQGIEIEILAEPTLRRVPEKVEQQLIHAGIPIRRVTHPGHLPMHNKFVLAEKNGRRWVIFGSFNWTTRSYWLNHEVGAISANGRLFDAFAGRWEILAAQGG